MPDDNRVEDGRLIRPPLLPDVTDPSRVTKEDQAFWNQLGKTRADIHCQVCGDSFVGNLDHLNMSEAPHKFKAKVPGVNYG